MKNISVTEAVIIFHSTARKKNKKKKSHTQAQMQHSAAYHSLISTTVAKQQ